MVYTLIIKRISRIICFLIISLLSLIYSANIAFASDVIPKLEVAPLNPDFVEFQKNISLSGGKLQSSLTFPLGYIPSPLSLPHRKVIKQPYGLPQLNPYPATFDLRKKKMLTPVRDQSTSGSCWAFAAIGSLESNLMPAEKLDFSENNLKNNSGFDKDPNTGGGNDNMSMAYFARWDGPVSEAEDKYDPSSTSSPLIKPSKHIQEVQQFGFTNMSYSEIKSSLIQHGAVATSMYWDPKYYNAQNKSYCQGSDDYQSNHEVVIVGWDDNYSKDKFNIKPPTNGAFIVRNSWGTSFGDKGYFYISYWDYNVGQENAVFMNAESINNYGSVYQYDTLGFVNSLGYNSQTPETAWIANAYTATSPEPLSAISFYTPVPNTSYEIRVYNNFDGTFITKAPLKAGTIERAGYYTINLGESIPVNTGEKFAVSVKLVTPNYTYPIPVEMPYQNYSSKATASPGQSYVSSNGSDWIDITEPFPNTNVCLKVFTAPVPTLTSATYDVSTGNLLLNGEKFKSVDGKANDIDVTKLTISSGEYNTTLTSATKNVEITSPTSATIKVAGTDKEAIKAWATRNGTVLIEPYNLAAAAGWNGANSLEDLTENIVTVSGNPGPSLQSAAYDIETGALTLTALNLIDVAGEANDIDVTKLTISAGKNKVSLTSETENVDISDLNTVVINVSGADKDLLNGLAAQNGSSVVGVAYNVSVAAGWNGLDSKADLAGNPMIVCGNPPPALTSAVYDVGTGTLTLTGTNFVNVDGKANDIDVTKLRIFSGDYSTTLSSVTSSVEISSPTCAVVKVGGTDKAAIKAWATRNGAILNGPYQISAAAGWNGIGSTDDLNENPVIVTGNAAPKASVGKATIHQGADVTTAKSTKIGTIYLVVDTIVITSKEEADAAVQAGTARSSVVTGPNKNVVIGTTGLEVGKYFVIAVDEAGNLSDKSKGLITIIN